MNSVGNTDVWVKDHGPILGKRVQAAVAGSASEDAATLAKRLREGVTAADVVVRKNLQRDPIRDAVDRRPPGHDGGESGAGLPALAEALGMTVGQLVSELAKEGVTLRQLFLERGVVPAPGSIADLAM
jgi:hypothetical protein